MRFAPQTTLPSASLQLAGPEAGRPRVSLRQAQDKLALRRTDKYPSGPSPCGGPVARPSSRSRDGVSRIMRARSAGTSCRGVGRQCWVYSRHQSTRHSSSPLCRPTQGRVLLAIDRKGNSSRMMPKHVRRYLPLNDHTALSSFSRRHDPRVRRTYSWHRAAIPP